MPALFALLGYAVLPLQSWDYWWHVTMGRLIVATGEVPSEALFLYTMEADATSFVQPWLAQWLLYLVHEGLGLRANLLLRGLVVAGSFGGVTWLAVRRSTSPMGAGLLGVAGLLVAFPFLDVRTNLFVLPLFVGTLVLVRRVHVGRLSPHALWAIGPIAAVWANLHGSFFMPAVVCGLYAAAELWRWGRSDEAGGLVGSVGALAAATVGGLVGPMANPRGWELYGYVYRVATDPIVQQTVTEWQMTTPAFPRMAGPVFYLLLVAGGLMLWTRRAMLEVVDLFLVVAFGALAVSQARGLIWFGLAMPVALAPYLAPDRRAGDWPRAGWAAVAVAGLLAVAAQPCWPWWPGLAASYQAVPVRTETPYRGAVPEETPIAAMQRLRGMDERPRLFHDERHAGFYLFHLASEEPEQLVFVDQRVELPGTDIWREYFEVSRAERWQTVFRMYGIEAAALHSDRQSRLVEALDLAEGWQRAAEEAEVVLFVRGNSTLARRSPGQLADRLLE